MILEIDQDDGWLQTLSQLAALAVASFPAHLERVEIVIEPETVTCAGGGCQSVRIGEDVSERLDVTPAKFRVIITRRPKYGCAQCKEGVSQAPAPAHIVEAGAPSEALLAHVAVSKYADGLPLYRQEGIYARDGVEISRNSMANWMGHVGFHLSPLAERVLALIKGGERVYADETTLPILSPGSGKTKTAWLWTYARDYAHPMIMRSSLGQSGIDISVIALWLGHESPATTHMYLQADLAMKERTLNRLQPMTASQSRYRPPDQLMQFLLSLLQCVFSLASRRNTGGAGAPWWIATVS